MGQGVDVEERGGKIIVKSGEVEKEFDAIFSAMGVVPNLEGLGLENCGLKLNEKGMPKVNPLTLQVENKALYIAGDVNGNRPILHEALDEGFAAGSNSVSQEVDSFCRRVSLNIVFCEPEIVMVGRSYEKLKRESVDFITGEVDFSDQARAKLEHRNEGLGHVYVSKADGRILGAEMICPDGEHLGHQLAQAIENDLYLADMLRCPFYHPSIEEGLRIALLDAAQQLPQEQRPGKVTLCSSRPEEPLN